MINRVSTMRSVRPLLRQNNLSGRPVSQPRTDRFVRFGSENNPLIVPVVTLPGTPEQGVKRALQAVAKVPAAIRQKLAEANFKVILCPTLQAGYDSEGVHYTEGELESKLASTVHAEGLGGLNVIPANGETMPFLENIVTHEIGHGWDLANGIRKNKEARLAYNQDKAALYDKLDAGGFTPDEQQFVAFMFPDSARQIMADPRLMFDFDFAKEMHKAEDGGFREALAEMTAWKLGKGVYGSGLPVYPDGRQGPPLVIQNPGLVRSLFPRLGAFLETHYPGR